MDIAYSVPAATTAKGVDINAQKSLTYSTTGEAMRVYHKAAERLLYVSRWNELTAEDNLYTLLDNRGRTKHGSVVKGDYIQVKRPHAQLTGKNEHEWLLVEKILQIKTEDLESTAIRVRFTSSPTAKPSACFSAVNTNTLVVERHGHTVRVNFHPHYEADAETSRVARAPAAHQLLVTITNWLGLTKNKWENLINGLLFD